MCALGVSLTHIQYTCVYLTHRHTQTLRWCDANDFKADKKQSQRAGEPANVCSPFGEHGWARKKNTQKHKWTEYAYAMNTICGRKVTDWVTDVGVAFITFGAALLLACFASFFLSLQLSRRTQFRCYRRSGEWVRLETPREIIETIIHVCRRVPLFLLLRVVNCVATTHLILHFRMFELKLTRGHAHHIICVKCHTKIHDKSSIPRMFDMHRHL